MSYRDVADNGFQASSQLTAVRRQAASQPSQSPAHSVEVDDDDEDDEAIGSLERTFTHGPTTSDFSEYFKSLVYGGLDGMLATLTTVAAVAGAQLNPAVTVALGLAHLFAGGVAMGLGDAVSAQADEDYNESERTKELWLMHEDMEGRIDNMVDLYIQKGLSSRDSRTIVSTMAKYTDVFLDHVLHEDLGIAPAGEPEAGPLVHMRNGALTAAAFVMFGTIPIFVYLLDLLPGVHIGAAACFWVSCLLAVGSMFALGAAKGKLVDLGQQKWWFSGAVMATNGAFTAAIAYLVGAVVKSLLSGSHAGEYLWGHHI